MKGGEMMVIENDTFCSYTLNTYHVSVIILSFKELTSVILHHSMDNLDWLLYFQQFIYFTIICLSIVIRLFFTILRLKLNTVVSRFTNYWFSEIKITLFCQILSLVKGTCNKQNFTLMLQIIFVEMSNKVGVVRRHYMIHFPRGLRLIHKNFLSDRAKRTLENHNNYKYHYD